MLTRLERKLDETLYYITVGLLTLSVIGFMWAGGIPQLKKEQRHD